MYLVNEDTMSKLPEEAQEVIKKNCQGIEDPEKVAEIEEMAGSKEEEPTDDLEEIEYGEGFKDKMKDDGSFDLPEKEKNDIKSFDDAADRGNALIVAVSDRPKKKQHGLNPIPKKEEEE